jgi:hypothetical protein
VSTDSKGYKSVEYSKLVALLLEAIKEQQKIIEKQKSDINGLKSDAERMKKLEEEIANIHKLLDRMNEQKPVKGKN